jgi:putative ABC transport system substrate-binding protein
MKRRQVIILVCGAAAAWPLAARAQQRALPVIGLLGSGSADTYRERLELIRQGLSQLGLAEGRNLAIEYRWAEGQLDRLPTLAADLVRRKVDVIIATGGLQAPRAAKAATAIIPIVFSTDGDPVKDGLVASLNRPGGNATGMTVLTTSLTAKRLDILRELVPKATILALLVNPSSVQASDQARDAEEIARALGLQFRALDAINDDDFEQAFAAIAGTANIALLVSADPLFVARRGRLAALALRHAIPTMYGRREFVTAGGLISYGANLAEPYRVLGIYAGRILKGEKASDLPVAQPTKFELIINQNTAKALGLVIPDQLLALADEMIE